MAQARSSSPSPSTAPPPGPISLCGHELRGDPPTLLESELFGYEEGAFTGGPQGRKRGPFPDGAEGDPLSG
ncbi:MAG: sigma 54-interacting transcriptional regulator [Intestinimonas sp.]